MTKKHSHYFLNILLLITISVSMNLSCISSDSQGFLEPLTVVPTLTSTSTLISPTSTIMPLICNSSPQISMTATKAAAEEWFQSTQMSIPVRDEYKQYLNWESFCNYYQEDYATQESWLTYPIEIALRFSGFPNPDNFPPSLVTTVYKRGDPNTVSVIILFTNFLDDSVRDKEIRVDLVKESKQWEIQWSGFRLRCYRNNSEEWVNTPCP